MGVIFALYNVIFAAVLLILVLIASIYAIASRNPEVRYQPMRDDRGSFIKSQAALTTELDALGATARGDGINEYSQDKKGFDDDESFSSESLKQQSELSQRPASQAQGFYAQQEQVPMYPGENTGRRGPQSYEQRQMYGQGLSGSGDYGYGSRPTTAPTQQPYDRSMSPSPLNPGYAPPRSAQSGYPPQQGFRQQNNSSPWQRGAGYD
jgi:hypothetical protein